MEGSATTVSYPSFADALDAKWGGYNPRRTDDLFFHYCGKQCVNSRLLLLALFHASFSAVARRCQGVEESKIKSIVDEVCKEKEYPVDKLDDAKLQYVALLML